MNLQEAMKAINDGKKIYRLAWLGENYLEKLDDGKIVCFRKDTSQFQYDLSILNSTGWVVMGEGADGKILDFSEAMRELTNKKKLRFNDWKVDAYIELSPYKKEIHLIQNVEYPFVPTSECLIADDWRIIE